GEQQRPQPEAVVVRATADLGLTQIGRLRQPRNHLHPHLDCGPVCHLRHHALLASCDRLSCLSWWVLIQPSRRTCPPAPADSMWITPAGPGCRANTEPRCPIRIRERREESPVGAERAQAMHRHPGRKALAYATPLFVSTV